MKIDWNRGSTTRAVYALIVVLIGVAFYSWLAHFAAVNAAVAKVLRPLHPVFWGMFFAYLLAPILRRVETVCKSCLPARFLQKPRRVRILSLIVTYLLVLLVIVAFVLIVLPQVVDSIKQITLQFRTYASVAQGWVNDLIARLPPDLIPNDYAAQLSDMTGEAVAKVFNAIGTSLPVVLDSLMQVGSRVISFFIACIVSIYVLSEKEHFGAQAKKVLFALLPRSRAQNCLEVFRTADRMFGGFITGKIIDSIIIGFLCFIGVSVLQMPNAVLVSFIVGVTNIIPYFGPFIGAIPSFFLIAFVSPMKGLVFLLFIIVLQQIDGNIIGPKILGNTTGLPSFWVLFAILFFGGMFGVIGMVIGVPLFGVIYWWLRLIITNRLAARDLPFETQAYMDRRNPYE